MPSFSLHSATLNQLAIAAWGRTKNDQTKIAPHQKDALVAVLFSAATLEAFMSELTMLTKNCSSSEGSNWQLFEALGQALAETEREKASIKLKFILTKSMLTGKSYDRGARPFQDFRLLFKLRDDIVHMKVEEVGRKPSATIDELVTKGLVEPVDPHMHLSWVDRVSTRAVAAWACNTAYDMTESIIEAIRIARPDQSRDFQFMPLGLQHERVLNLD